MDKRSIFVTDYLITVNRFQGVQTRNRFTIKVMVIKNLRTWNYTVRGTAYRKTYNTRPRLLLLEQVS